MEGLLDHELVIVAGKGGVGKTTTSSAIALEAARLGRRTLLVTVDPAKRLEDSLGVAVGFSETSVQPGLTAMMLDPEAVVREHLAKRLPEAKVTEHPLFKYVTGTMPGLNELMAIGKLNDLRREGRFDLIVVDTAPTGHALSFLSVPKAMKEIMSERSLLRWALRGYQVWQRVQGAAKNVQNAFRLRKDRTAPPDVDLEAVFGDIQQEAEHVQDFLTDARRSVLVLVTLPEKMPVEETLDLHRAVTGDLGMTVHVVVVNKVQPDALQGVEERFDALAGDPVARSAFIAKAAEATGEPEALLEAILDATAFGEVRRAMNVGFIKDLQTRLDAPLVGVPLFPQDVQGLRRLEAFRKELFDATNVLGRPAA